MQLVLESPKDGRQYMFELNDRLIRDKELDGLTEIPVKPDTDGQQLKPDDAEDDEQADGLQQQSRLPCQSCTFTLFIVTLYALVILLTSVVLPTHQDHAETRSLEVMLEETRHGCVRSQVVPPSLQLNFYKQIFGAACRSTSAYSL